MEREPGIPIFVVGAVISQTADNLLVADGGDLIGGCPSVIWLDKISTFTVCAPFL